MPDDTGTTQKANAAAKAKAKPKPKPAKAAAKASDKTDAKAKRAKASTKRRRAAAAEDGQLRLTGDRLVVRLPGNGERTSTGGLLIPATAATAPKRLAWAEVTLTGPDVRVAEPGDRILFLPAAGLEVELDGEDLVLLRERDVQGVTSPTKQTRTHGGQYL